MFLNSLESTIRYFLFMKSLKIRQFIILSLFICQYNAVNSYETKPKFSNFESNKEDILFSGWKPRKNLSKKGNKPNLKTIEALDKFKKISSLKSYFKNAAGYAIFPNIGKAGIGIGGARGKGEVFEKDEVIGSTTVTQLSIGFQLGGQAFSQIIFFKNKKDLERFTQGNYEFGASASAALITEGANASADYSDGVAVLTYSKGGLMYEASIGGQKFSFEKY
tara:strand:- start:354 stop:1016 length:663 start_codon:yes stop_codon:yes gene_type:complete